MTDQQSTHSLLPAPELRQQFAQRRLRQILITVPVALALFALHSVEGDAGAFGLPSTVVILGALAIVVAALAFSVYNWRCPSCDRYLGRSWNPAYCPKCGFQLKSS